MSGINDEPPEEPLEDENPFDGERRPYAVGYGKPPREHRFKKGNRAAAGKRRKSKFKGVDQLLLKVAGERIEVLVKGKRVRMARREALLRYLFDRALKSPKDAAALIQLLRSIDEQPAFQVEPHAITIEFIGDRPKGLPGGPDDPAKAGNAPKPKALRPTRWPKDQS